MLSGDDGQYRTPQARARLEIDGMLTLAGWVVQDRDELDLHAAQGVAVREVLLTGNTEADYSELDPDTLIAEVVDELLAAAGEVAQAAALVDEAGTP